MKTLKNKNPMKTSNYLERWSALPDQRKGQRHRNVNAVEFFPDPGQSAQPGIDPESGKIVRFKSLHSLNRKLLMLKWILLLLFMTSAGRVWTQTSQSPTQNVSVGNEPYLVTGTPGSTYNWTITPGNPGTEWAINGTGNSITVNWNMPGVYTLSVVETNAAGCHGLPVTVIVTVNQTPNVNDPPDQTVCNGSPTTSVNFTGDIPGTVYNWINNTPSIGLVSTGSGNIASFNAVNTGISPVVATITVTPSYTIAGITYTGTPQSFTITVNPLPVTSPIYHN
jgi:hypothetical protein